MKLFIKMIPFLLILLFISQAKAGQEGTAEVSGNYWYAVEVGRVAIECEKFPGGYQDFVMGIQDTLASPSMNCTDVNEFFKTKFGVMCVNPQNLYSVTSFWFTSKKDCTNAMQKKMR